MATTRKSKALGLPLVFVSLALMLLAGYTAVSQSEPRTNPTPMSEESIAAGEAVFFEYCAGCHGRRADGRGLQALNLIPKPQNLRNAEFVRYLTDERMYSSISGGVRGTSMPPFELIINPDKRWDVTNYIRSLTAGDELGLPNSVAYQKVAADAPNPVARDETSIALGKKLYMNFCASCHGGRADGEGLIAPNLVPAPRNLVVVTSFGEKPFIDYLSDARLYDSVTNGVPGTSMLPWIKVMNDEERWSVINFMRAQADVEREKSDKIYE